LQRKLLKQRAARRVHVNTAMRLGKISDGSLGTLLATIGIIMMCAAVLTDKQPFAALPGMDGAMTAGTLGFILALLHGLSFRRSLQLMTPIVFVQAVGSTLYQCNIVALIGLELGIYGLIGIAVTWYRDVRAEQLAR
jgi:hypothetical protein